MHTHKPVRIIRSRLTIADRIALYSALAATLVGLFATWRSSHDAREQLEAQRNEVLEQIKEQRNDVLQQIAEQREEVKIQHLVDEQARFDQEPELGWRRALAAKRMDRVHQKLRSLTYDNSPSELWNLLSTCDHVGLLTRRGYLDVEDVWNELGFWFFNIYTDAQKVIAEDRQKHGDPASMENCTWLVDQMRPIEAKRANGAQLNLDEDSIYQFYDGEVDAKPGQIAARSHH